MPNPNRKTIWSAQTMKLNNRIWHLATALAPFAAVALTLVASRRWL